MPFAELEGITISYQDTGVPVNAAKHGGNYTAIILVHGFRFNSHVFDLFLPHLSPDYRLIAYDRRGYGQTRTPTASSTGSEHPSDLLALIAHLRATGLVPAKLTILAWSAGVYHALLATDGVPKDEALPFDVLALYEPASIPVTSDIAEFSATFCRIVATYYDAVTGEEIPDRNSLDLMPPELATLCVELKNEESFIHARSRLDEELVVRVLGRVPVGLLFGTMSSTQMITTTKRIGALGVAQSARVAVVAMEGLNHIGMTDHPDILAESVKEVLGTIP
ncbi:Alpha/Beta hydrolase protein [Jimgerdemannia flammicorona]|uniref:Alpha/Beta hydrolase protein n=2 Tax=Jimgerdemannia flammicorona TaxID=994334 RepID=A0A433CZ86_9FUNG|nr:Alpha/Beta hydrolase protein [Jimgerdemannia flammicorona]RUS31293.1 Alpha/Beta hydrolase protein [Jimgerdemannia flammicorona]